MQWLPGTWFCPLLLTSRILRVHTAVQEFRASCLTAQASFLPLHVFLSYCEFQNRIRELEKWCARTSKSVWHLCSLIYISCLGKVAPADDLHQLIILLNSIVSSAQPFLCLPLQNQDKPSGSLWHKANNYSAFCPATSCQKSQNSWVKQLPRGPTVGLCGLSSGVDTSPSLSLPLSRAVFQEPVGAAGAFSVEKSVCLLFRLL